MADTLYQRTVEPSSSAGDPQIGITINVVVPHTVLLGGAGAAHVDGYGPIPGDLARELASDAEALVALRRLYTEPETGWLARPRPGPRHTVETTTPTGHRYRSRAPAVGAVPRHRRRRVDTFFPDLMLAC